MERAVKANKPFFLWWNSTRMHVFTHLKEESEGVTGLGIYADGMVEHDKHVGQLLDKVDELGIADNTIVMYSTDNGAEVFLWPDGGITPFRNEKNSNWDGGYRVPTLIKWPGVIKPGIGLQRCVLPRGHAADHHGRGWRAGHQGEAAEGTPGRSAGTTRSIWTATTCCRTSRARWKRPRARSSSTGPTTASSPVCATIAGRWSSWSSARMASHVWQEPLVTLRVPKLFDMRGDPFERADHEAEGYNLWRFERAYLILPAVRLCRAASGDLQGVPAAPEAGQLQPGSGAGDAAEQSDHELARLLTDIGPAPSGAGPGTLAAQSHKFLPAVNDDSQIHSTEICSKHGQSSTA